MSDLELVLIEKIILSCNEILGGKFLDLRQKLNNLMEAVVKSDETMAYLAEVLSEYDTEAGIRNAFPSGNKSKINVPKDDNQKLALTISVLNDIDREKINLTKFLETYFKDDNSNPIRNFGVILIKPFRDILAKHFEVDVDVTEEDVKKHSKNIKVEEPAEEEEEELPGLFELIEKIEVLANSALGDLKFEKRDTDDVEFILEALLRACELKDLMIVNGLVSGLAYASKKIKGVRFIVSQMNALIYEYYDGLEMQVANCVEEDQEVEEIEDQEEEEE